jgi:hypothetical protein
MYWSQETCFVLLAIGCMRERVRGMVRVELNETLECSLLLTGEIEFARKDAIRCLLWLRPVSMRIRMRMAAQRCIRRWILNTQLGQLLRRYQCITTDDSKTKCLRFDRKLLSCCCSRASMRTIYRIHPYFQCIILLITGSRQLLPNKEITHPPTVCCRLHNDEKTWLK